MNDKQKAELFRNMFKGRQDVYGREKISPDGRKSYYPVCGNPFITGCHLGKNDGVACSDCAIRKYAPVTNESVLKHIHGEEAHSFYPLCNDIYLCERASAQKTRSKQPYLLQPRF